MSKAQIEAQLSEVILDEKGEIKSNAFSYYGGVLFAPWALLLNSGGPSAPFDYSTKNFFLDRENYLFITDDGTNIVGHDYRKMGNFLWGAATYIMHVPEAIALFGANMNNLFTEPGWRLDSPDDHYAIKLGRNYAKVVGWSTVYGGRNNIFK